MTKIEGKHSPEYILAFLKASCAEKLAKSSEEELKSLSITELKSVENLGFIPTSYVASHNSPGFKGWVWGDSCNVSAVVPNIQELLSKAVDVVVDTFSSHYDTFTKEEFPFPSYHIEDGKIVYHQL